MDFHNLLLALILGLLAATHASPITENGPPSMNDTLAFNASAVQGYDPSFEYHDYSTVQVWMGKDKRMVGTMVGPNLYNKVTELLNKGCPEGTKGNTCHDVTSGSLTFTSRCMLVFPGGIGDCTTEIFGVSAKWENEATRKLLVHLVAGALAAVTEQGPLDPTNCVAIASERACNVGDVVRVNLPKYPNGSDNFMHIRIWNSNTWYGTWDCCHPKANHRQHMDSWIDMVGPKIIQEFPQWWNREFTRDSRCIINEWQAC